MSTVLNALADVSVINSAMEYVNTYGKQVRPELFYNKILLDTIRLGKEHYVHYGLADLSPIQGRAEKLQLRRWSPLNAHTVPLVEGIPPKSDKGAMESWELGVAQYGRYMEFTDKVEWTLIDPIISHYTQQYAIVAVETLDLLAREALLATPNKYFSGLATGIGGMQIGDAFKPSLQDLRVIALGFKKRLVKPRKNGKFLVIGTPDFFFDMVTDPIVEKYLTINNTTKNVYTNTMIPDLFDLTFTETQAHEDTPEFMFIHTTGSSNVTTKALRLYRPAGASYEYMTVYEKDDEGVDTGFLVTQTDVMTGDKYRFQDKELNAVPELVTWDLDAINTAHQGVGAEWAPLRVQRIIIVGAKALIRTNVEGRDNAKMYVKPLGSAGVLDPINQRQSIGFKIDAVGFGVERLDAVAIYHCVPSQANA
jgi:hypothetical protein